MKRFLLMALVLVGSIGFGLYRYYSSLSNDFQSIEQEKNIPMYLYKILSIEDWESSKTQDRITLSSMDEDFIHLATDEQLDKIIAKFWAQTSEVVVLKLNVADIPGEIKFEQNPGGANKYYHLYHGFIPQSAVVDVEIRKVK